MGGLIPTESVVVTVEMTRAEGTIKAEGTRVEVEVETARIAPNAERKMTVMVHEAAVGAVFQAGPPNDELGPIKSVNKKNEAYVPG